MGNEEASSSGSWGIMKYVSVGIFAMRVFQVCHIHVAQIFITQLLIVNPNLATEFEVGAVPGGSPPWDFNVAKATLQADPKQAMMFAFLAYNVFG